MYLSYKKLYLGSAETPTGLVHFSLVRDHDGDPYVEREIESNLPLRTTRMELIYSPEFANHELKGLPLSNWVAVGLEELESQHHYS